MGIPTLISTSTASGASTVSITSGIDSTYDEYMFVLTDIGPASDDVIWQWNMSTDSGSNYNVTKTSTYFRSNHSEGGTGAAVAYEVGSDLAQGTGFQYLAEGVGADADQSSAGILHLFNPASTTYVKQFYSRVSNAHNSNKMQDSFASGYGNTTSAVDAVQFKMSSGNFDGVIQLFGIA